jgi:predicted O-linked N-acetylglucosamine transferase (SPINDLY family)
MSEYLPRAIAAHRAGDSAAAEAAYRAHLEAAPNEPVGLHGLGLLLHQRGAHAEAARLIEHALAAGLPGAAPWANLAAVYLADHAAERACAAARAGLAREPQHFGANLNLGLAALALGQHRDALASLRVAQSQRPEDAKTALALAQAAQALGDHDAAYAALQLASAAAPEDTELAFALGAAASRSARPLTAVAALRRALAAPNAPRDTRLLLASALLDLGDAQASVRESDALLAQAPEYREAASNRLIALQHVPGMDNSRLIQAHRDWVARFLPEDAVAMPAAPRGARERLTLGFVSPRFHQGPVATFLAPVLQHLDRARFRVVLLACSAYADADTARLRDLADEFIAAHTLDDAALRDAIAAAGVDVLFDLAGHAPANRLALFARRAAPLQISWLDYFCTTGLERIDAFFSDAVLTPEHSTQRYSERLVRLPRGRLCYAPPANAPAPTARADDGTLRLGSFNRLSKLNAAVAQTWSAILRALPHATLTLKADGLQHAEVRDWVYVTRFAPHGIARDRLLFQSFGTYADTLRAYADIDIALDPFPFSGCATSCDALWMGVPVITLAGETLVARQSASLLDACGLRGLIADTPEQYVDLAVSLGRDGAQRAAWRTPLRERARIGFANAAAYTRAFEAAIWAAWQHA